MQARARRTLYVPTIAGQKVTLYNGIIGTRKLTAYGEVATWTIGADADCDIQIDHPNVSGKHAVLIAKWERSENRYRWLIADDDSTNGTGMANFWLTPKLQYPVAPIVWLGRNVRLNITID